MQSGGGPLGQRPVNLTSMSSRDLTRLLERVTSSGHTPLGDEDEDESEENYDEDGYSTHRAQQWYPPHKVPQPAGLELLASGDFGRVSVKDRVLMTNRNVSKRLFARMTELPINMYKEDIASVSFSSIAALLRRKYISVQSFVPNTNGAAVASFSANVYTGQYSAGDYHITCFMG